MGNAFWYWKMSNSANIVLLLIYVLEGSFRSSRHYLASWPTLPLNFVVCISVLLSIVRWPDIETRIAC